MSIKNCLLENEYWKIHEQEGCIQKIKDGLTYENKSWSRFTYECSNPIFNNVIKLSRDC